ncbi:MAG: hypothetical protein ACFBSD_09060 [Paracoccaceae bacterium]
MRSYLSHMVRVLLILVCVLLPLGPARTADAQTARPGESRSEAFRRERQAVRARTEALSATRSRGPTGLDTAIESHEREVFRRRTRFEEGGRNAPQIRLDRQRREIGRRAGEARPETAAEAYARIRRLEAAEDADALVFERETRDPPPRARSRIADPGPVETDATPESLWPGLGVGPVD